MFIPGWNCTPREYPVFCGTEMHSALIYGQAATTPMRENPMFNGTGSALRVGHFPGWKCTPRECPVFCGRKRTPCSYTSRPHPRPCARTLRLRGREAQNELTLLSAELFLPARMVYVSLDENALRAPLCPSETFYRAKPCRKGRVEPERYRNDILVEALTTEEFW